MRKFANHLEEINNQLASYPDAMDSSKLSSEKVVEILKFALPKVWRMHMTLKRFIPREKVRKDLVGFCRELQDLEAFGKAKGLKPKASNKTTTTN